MTNTLSPRPPIEAAGVPPALFAHVVLQTARVDEMKDWYCTVLSAHVVHEGHGLCFLTYDDEHHRIALLSAPGLEPSQREQAGVHHVAYSFAELGQLLSTYRHLKAKGILPARSINHGPTTSLYYRDPDGNRVEMQVDNFSTKDEAARFFHSDEFERNPIGVQFDPEDLIRDYEAGVALADLLRRPPLPPGATPDDMRSDR